jgi:hypothetical protein
MITPILDQGERRLALATFHTAVRARRSVTGCYCAAIDAVETFHPDVPRQVIAAEVVRLLAHDVMLHEVANRSVSRPAAPIASRSAITPLRAGRLLHGAGTGNGR